MAGVSDEVRNAKLSFDSYLLATSNTSKSLLRALGKLKNSGQSVSQTLVAFSDKDTGPTTSGICDHVYGCF